MTWGQEVSGEGFISQARSYGAFGADKSVLEIGPGYGRLLRECIKQELPFRKYVAVDISAENVEYLNKGFDRADVRFVLEDIETASLEERFDTVLSSLTFKHLYPSFESALRNTSLHLNPQALVIFDLFEGEGGEFIQESAFNRGYSRSEVEEILARIPLELVAFDEVRHDAVHVRLLVVARKPN